MAVPTIDVPAAVPKAALLEIMPYRGVLNANAMCLNGSEYGPFTLVLVGFMGSSKADGLFHGHYVFRMAQAQDGERDAHDLSVLPNMPSVLATTDDEVIVEDVPAPVDMPDDPEEMDNGVYTHDR